VSSWRTVGGTGERYPEWVRALDGKSGAYAIRTTGVFAPTVVYVGESHTGSLYKTLTRHFQGWSRSRAKSWWAGQFSPAQTDPGHTYPRDKCEVFVNVTSRGGALDRQNALIRRFKPRDNHTSQEVPF